MKRLIVLTLLTVLPTIPAAFASDPGSQEKPVRIEVLTDKESYQLGEDVAIEVQAINTTEEEVTLRFPMGYQADYSIDGKFLWSWDKGFITMLTSVVIPAGDSHSWHFVHTADEWLLPPGKHVITGMVFGYGHSQPKTICVGERKDLEVTVSTDKELYSAEEEMTISVAITNKGESEVVLHFRSAREAGYSIDNRYFHYNGSDALDVHRTVTLGPGDSETWHFAHDLREHPLAAGEHTVVGIVVGYGHSAPKTIVIESGLEITVRTDKTEYDLDENVKIFVEATNKLPERVTLTFRSSHQATYIIDGVYHGPIADLALGGGTELTIEGNSTKTWEFTHTPDDYRLLPGNHSIVGVVIGYGKSDPTEIHVAEGETPLEVSVSTDKESYEQGEPVRIKVTARNASEQPVTLHFPSLHYVDYQIDEEYLWSSGKFFLPIPTSFTLPPGVEVSWVFVHRAREYELLPGDHTIVGIVVGYGRSEPVTVHVNEEEPGQMTIQGLLVEQEELDGNNGGSHVFLLYTRESEVPYHLFPDGVDLRPHVNMTVEVSGYPIETFAPDPWGIPFGVTSIRDLLRVEVDTDKRHYYQQEDICISVIARNLTDETFVISLHSLSEIIARLDGTIVPPEEVLPDFSLEPHVVAEIPPRETHAWEFIYHAEENPLSLGEHTVSGEITGYGKSRERVIKVIEKPCEKIVAEGIVIAGVDDVLGNSLSDVPGYVLVDRKTGEKLYILRNPLIDFGRYVGQYVEVTGVSGEAINFIEPAEDADDAIPELFVLRIRRLLAIAVSTDKVEYASEEAMNVFVTARNCTPREMTLVFDSTKQAYYQITCPGTGYEYVGEREEDTQEVVIGPYGLHVWEFTENRHAPAEEGEYLVTGFVNGYGHSKSVSVSVKPDPREVVTATGIVEKVWWRHWHWFGSCWYILFDPEEKQVTYFLSSDRVELYWYVGKEVRITGYRLDPVFAEPILRGNAASASVDDGSQRPIPPILPPWEPPEHLNVVSVVPIGDGVLDDKNGNGLPDSWEITTGLDEIGGGKDEDSDGDGVSNLREYFCGTDPLDIGSVVKLLVEVHVTGMVTLRWNTVPGRTYSVYCTDGFSEGAPHWRRLVGGIEGTGDEFSWTDEGAPDIAPSNAPGVTMRLYRVAVE